HIEELREVVPKATLMWCDYEMTTEPNMNETKEEVTLRLLGFFSILDQVIYNMIPEALQKKLRRLMTTVECIHDELGPWCAWYEVKHAHEKLSKPKTEVSTKMALAEVSVEDHQRYARLGRDMLE